jgi:two-component system phosphate regulon sensor histidine kinase PhoR
MWVIALIRHELILWASVLLVFLGLWAWHRWRVTRIRQEIEEFHLQEFNQQLDQKLALAEQERTLSTTILSALVESVIALDHLGRILFLNPAAEKLFDVQSAAVNGRPYLEVLRHAALNEVLADVLSGSPVVSREITVHTPTERSLAIQARPVDYNGQTGVLAALHDITELRRLENIRREFVANVSHELKTPLTSIKGFVDTLLEGAIDDPKNSRPFLKTIQDHADNLSQLIDDVLDLSAIEAERVDYRFETISLNDVAARIVKALEPMAKTRKVTITNELKADVPKVRADREKLAQIMMNLIDNAIKFNMSGGEVRVGASANGTRLHVFVKDTGRGISEEDLPRVFERFYRGNKDRSHEIPGTGLGLAIVKHLVEAHQGTVSVKSAPGSGSHFEFTLPLA